jgi:hypothetical protein
MKKLLLTLCLAIAALASQAQSYYYYQTKGATDAQWYLFGGGTTSTISDSQLAPFFMAVIPFWLYV